MFSFVSGFSSVTAPLSSVTVQIALTFDRNLSCLDPPSHEQIFIHKNFLNLCTTALINGFAWSYLPAETPQAFELRGLYIPVMATGTKPIIRYEHNYMVGIGQWLDCGWDGRGIWVHFQAETESKRPLGSTHPRIQRAMAVCNQGFK